MPNPRKPEKRQEGNLFDGVLPPQSVKFHIPSKDGPAPIGKWLIRVSSKYVNGLDLGPSEKFVLGLSFASQSLSGKMRWYHYTDSTVRILKSPTFEETLA